MRNNVLRSVGRHGEVSAWMDCLFVLAHGFICSSLVGSLYILDEPSIGLHPKDTKRLIEVLYGLRDLGNTVIVVEHDDDIMRSADEIIDLGPSCI